ncbi:MAG: ribulose-phosphate 3-epimerase [Spirochaetia bacterium]|uniref:ribulose-phosphate 3-epimerase n=1 Tax=Treponema berlinense TaxID=225004 RepID=UPI0026F2247A|nr:ribulose-phosphate 3-epimerase [Treponema berlinense]MDD5789261.1 ribulose-phosphate 3-epimerase [Spirochaetia bacterium]
MKSRILSPSLLSADFSSLEKAVKLCEEKGAGAVHIDVMDGHFVPQITYGQPVIKSIRKLTDLPFDVHLMVERPGEMIESFAQAGADWITFHQEAAVHADRIIGQIHSLGKKAGISIVPSTPVCLIKEILPLVDLVLVMTVNPGFGGQKFIPYCGDKIAELAAIRKEKGCGFLISVDGGVNAENLSSVLDLGADVVVSGSAFFNGSFRWEA